MRGRLQPTLRSTIAITIAAAVLASTVVLGLIAFGVVRTNESGYVADIKQRQAYFARAVSAFADLLHTQVEGWIMGQPTAPSLTLTQAYVQRAAHQVLTGGTLPVSWLVLVVDPRNVVGCAGGQYPTGVRESKATATPTPTPTPTPLVPKDACPGGDAQYVTRGDDLQYPGGPAYHVVVSKLAGTAVPLLLAVVAPSATSPAARGDFAWPTLGVIAGGTALALLIGLGVGQSVRRPLRRTASAARRFGSGDHSIRVPVGGTDELADLGHAFNAMADQLEATLDELHRSQAVQRRFVADVSHELRSPLATMLAAVQGLHGDPTTQRRSTELLDIQTLRLAGILEDLLEISRFDAGQATLLLEDVDVLEIVEDAIGTVAPAAPVPVEGHGPTVASVDARRVHTVVRNLVANAVQHGEPPVHVDVDGTDPDWVKIQVADAGPGIEAERAGEIFQRFVRGDQARSARDANSGLGLAIAAENAGLHGGTLTIHPEAPTRFTLSLPRTPDGLLPHDEGGTAS